MSWRASPPERPSSKPSDQRRRMNSPPRTRASVGPEGRTERSNQYQRRRMNSPPRTRASAGRRPYGALKLNIRLPVIHPPLEHDDDEAQPDRPGPQGGVFRPAPAGDVNVFSGHDLLSRS